MPIEYFAEPCQNPRKRPHTKRFGGITTDLCKCLLIKKKGKMMKPKLIKTGKDYQAALARLDEIFEAQPGTADGDEAELLTTLIEMYEEQKYPIDLPDPVSAIKFRMEQEEWKR